MDTLVVDHLDRSGVSGKHPAGPLFEEAFRTLRASLLVRVQGTPSVMITSARPGEGKSTIAANLAWSLAFSGQVALVDADFRRPCQHELFRLPNELGFADVLAGRARLDRCFQRVTSSLTVVTGGSKPRDLIELLDRARFDAALDALRADFNFVLVDSPPVLAVADAMVIGACVSGVLLVLKWGEVTESEALLARRRLESSGSTLIGCVVNQFPGTDDGDYHPYVKKYAETSVHGQPGAVRPDTELGPLLKASC